MVNFKIIYKVIGSLLFIEAIMMLACLAVSIYYRDDDIPAFLITITVTLLAAIGLKYKGYGAENSLGRREAYLLVTLIWLIFSALGALPFVISGYLTSYTDAFFETMSGFTTTGATIIDDVEALPHGLLFWRSLTHWIGGLGIMFFTIAILPSLVGGSVKVFSAEATGPIKSKMHPRLSTTAKGIWGIYLLITASCAACFWLFGMGFFDRINYSMSIAATGGFSTHNASMAFFDSAAIDYTAAIFMILSGVNFSLLYLLILKGKVKDFVKDSELRFYIGVISISTLFITYMLVTRNGISVADSFRYALFQVSSFISTTGLFNTDAGLWPHLTWLALTVCMVFGSCAGSTSGGIKCIRGAMLVRVIRNEFKRLLHPRAVIPVKLNGTIIPHQAQATLLVFLSLYGISCLAAFFCFQLMGIESTNAITIAISSASNVGPALGADIGPTMSWSTLPIAAKWICSALMLMGRLEFFSVLVLFMPSFWKEN